MKKILAAILALCMLGMLLAGCGNTSSATSTASDSAPQTEDSAPEKSSDLFVPSAAPAATSAEEEASAAPAGPSYTLPISEEGLTIPTGCAMRPLRRRSLTWTA